MCLFYCNFLLHFFLVFQAYWSVTIHNGAQVECRGVGLSGYYTYTVNKTMTFPAIQSRHRLQSSIQNQYESIQATTLHISLQISPWSVLAANSLSFLDTQTRYIVSARSPNLTLIISAFDLFHFVHLSSLLQTLAENFYIQRTCAHCFHPCRKNSIFHHLEHPFFAIHH